MVKIKTEYTLRPLTSHRIQIEVSGLHAPAEAVADPAVLSLVSIFGLKHVYDISGRGILTKLQPQEVATRGGGGHVAVGEDWTVVVGVGHYDHEGGRGGEGGGLAAVGGDNGQFVSEMMKSKRLLVYCVVGYGTVYLTKAQHY